MKIHKSWIEENSWPLIFTFFDRLRNVSLFSMISPFTPFSVNYGSTKVKAGKVIFKLVTGAEIIDRKLYKPWRIEQNKEQY